MKANRLGIVSALVCASSAGLADVTGFSASTTSYAVHHNVMSSPPQVFFQTLTAFPHSFFSPYTVSMPGTMAYSTQATTAASLSVNLPQIWEYQSSLAGEASTNGSPNPGPSTGYTEIQLATSISITLDAPGSLSLFSTNTVSILIPESMYATALATKFVTLNGNPIYGSFADGSYFTAIGAGTHTVSITKRVLASFVASDLGNDNAYAYGVIRNRLRIESVPEPSTMALGGGLLGVLLRKRRKNCAK